MDGEKGAMKPLLLSLSAMKKKLLPPSLLAEIRVSSLLALLFACGYGGLAAYNLRHAGQPCQAPSWVFQCYELEGEDAEAA